MEFKVKVVALSFNKEYIDKKSNSVVGCTNITVMDGNGKLIQVFYKGLLDPKTEYVTLRLCSFFDSYSGRSSLFLKVVE